MLAYGDHGGAIGYLVGEENRGLEYMFIMMNLARFSVGMEGVGIAERAYQRAVAYARDRVQGRPVGADKGARAGPIIEHPDIRRMLMTMRAYTEADARASPTSPPPRSTTRTGIRMPRRASAHQAFVDLMIPIVKGWSHRDRRRRSPRSACRCTAAWASSRRPAPRSTCAMRASRTIYEGTTGIQANDLIGRKTARDGGAVARGVAGEIDKVAAELAAHADADLQAIGAALADANAALQARDRLDGAGVRRAARARRTRGRCRISSSGARWPAAGSSAARRSSRRSSWPRARATRGFLHAKIATARYLRRRHACRRPRRSRSPSRRPANRRWRSPRSSSESRGGVAVDLRQRDAKVSRRSSSIFLRAAGVACAGLLALTWAATARAADPLAVVPAAATPGPYAVGCSNVSRTFRGSCPARRPRSTGRASRATTARRAIVTTCW